eukprot:1195398-Prorocentrum_minimum.AAC.7
MSRSLMAAMSAASRTSALAFCSRCARERPCSRSTSFSTLPRSSDSAAAASRARSAHSRTSPSRPRSCHESNRGGTVKQLLSRSRARSAHSRTSPSRPRSCLATRGSRGGQEGVERGSRGGQEGVKRGSRAARSSPALCSIAARVCSSHLRRSALSALVACPCSTPSTSREASARASAIAFSLFAACSEYNTTPVRPGYSVWVCSGATRVKRLGMLRCDPGVASGYAPVRPGCSVWRKTARLLNNSPAPAAPGCAPAPGRPPSAAPPMSALAPAAPPWPRAPAVPRASCVPPPPPCGTVRPPRRRWWLPGSPPSA